MKKLFLTITTILLIPAFVFGGRISGTIKEGNGHIGPDKLVSIIDSNNNGVASDSTDAYGSYSIYIQGAGKYWLTLKYSNNIISDPIEIYSYQKSAARYDFILYQVDSTTYRLKRK